MKHTKKLFSTVFCLTLLLFVVSSCQDGFNESPLLEEKYRGANPRIAKVYDYLNNNPANGFVNEGTIQWNKEVSFSEADNFNGTANQESPESDSPTIYLPITAGAN